jgi:hypothetical protein
MSNEKALAIIPKTLTEVQSLADMFAKSALMPDALRGKAADVFVSIMAGQELGLPPMAAIRGVHVVQGKSVLSADTRVGIVLGSGLAEYFVCVEDSLTGATYETKRKGSPVPQRCTWGIDDAKRSGFNTKENYRLHPRAMFKARAKAMLARDVYPDVLAGCYDPDELAHVGGAAPIMVPPREPDAVDAEIVEPGAEMVAEINGAESAEQLSALAPKINKLPKGSAERNNAMAAFKARQAFFAAPSVTNGVNAEATAAP